MTLIRLKIVAAVVCCLVLLGTGGGLYYHAPLQGKGPEVAAIGVPLLAVQTAVLEKNKIEIPSESDGVIQVIGVPLDKSQVVTVKPEQRKRLLKEGKWVQAAIGVLLVEELRPDGFQPDELFDFPDVPNSKYRMSKKGERLTPGKVRVGLREITFRKLKVGERVENGQILAMADPKLALDDLEVKIAKFEEAEAARRSAEKARDEAQKRYEGFLAVTRRTPNAISQDELRVAQLTWDRFREEEIAKRAALRIADRELNIALTQLRMHEIRSPVAGVIRKIYKQRGEAIKKLESVFQIECEEEP